MFKQHLEMIGRNETPSKKAKFWQSYIRSLKGSDDIRAQDTPKTRTPWRSDYSPVFKSIYDEPSTASERITGAGYRYLPVHRDTYGYSPRAIYSHHYNRPTSTYEHNRYDAEKAWQEHQERMKEIERRYPSRYGLYLKDKPSAAVVPLEYEPEDKPIRAGTPSRNARANSVPPLSPGLRASSLAPFPSLFDRGARASSLAPLDSFLRAPVFRTGWVPYNSLTNLHDPFLDYIVADSRPFSYLPAHLRNAYVSPFSRATRRPLRLFDF